MTPVNETLAQYSELFMLIASFIYLVAFLLFSWDMATASRSIRKLEAELETQQSKQLVGAGGPGVDEPSGSTKRRQLVSDDMENGPRPILRWRSWRLRPWPTPLRSSLGPWRHPGHPGATCMSS